MASGCDGLAAKNEVRLNVTSAAPTTGGLQIRKAARKAKRRSIALAIDGLNILNAAEEVGKQVDFAELLDKLSGNGRYPVAYKNFYIGPPGDGKLPANGSYEKLRKGLIELGYNWVCCGSPGSRAGAVKSNVDVRIAADLTAWASRKRARVIYLASGDGDLAHVVYQLRRECKVCVLGILAGKHVSRAFLKSARPGEFLDLEEMGVLRPWLPGQIGGSNGQGKTERAGG